ncbi:MAG: hypothetical protein MZV63_65195 [Marinilabiliales bacterium]|nr:hypothetical protein [Marinilabiliales bacterium]
MILYKLVCITNHKGEQRMVDIEKIEKRTVRSFYEDGLFEIALGLVFLLLGGCFFAPGRRPGRFGLRARS